MITAVDQGVGRIIKVLKSRDMIENTIFAFVSDVKSLMILKSTFLRISRLN